MDEGGPLRQIDVSHRALDDVFIVLTKSYHSAKKAKIIPLMHKLPSIVGVSNGPIQLESARKIWPLLELLAKIR